MQSFTKHLFIIFALLGITIGCDDDSGSNSTDTQVLGVKLLSSKITYDVSKESLVAHISGQILDTQGNPVPNAFLSVVLPNDSTPFTQTTDASGVGKILVPYNKVEVLDASLCASLSQGDLIKNCTSISISYGFYLEFNETDIKQEAPNVCRTVTFTFLDDDGVISNAKVLLTTTTDPTTTTSTDELQTDENGSFPLNLCSEQNIAYYFQVSLKGVDGVIEKTTSLHGPNVAGTVESLVTYRSVYNPRIGVMTLDGSALKNDVVEQILKEELFSMPISICPTEGKGFFSFNLPPTVPNELMTQDGSNLIGLFPVFMYDDLNENAQWDRTEPIFGIRMHQGIPTYISNDATSTWVLMNELGEDATLLPWEPNASHLDLKLTSIPTYSFTATGDVFLNDLDLAVDQIKVAMIAWPAHNDIIDAIDNNQFAILGRTTLEGTGIFTLEATDLKLLIDATTLETWTDTDDQITYIPVTIIMYHDENQDNKPQETELIGGLTYTEFGSLSQLSYVIQYLDEYVLFSDLFKPLNIRYGYNLYTAQLETTIEQVIDASTLIVSYDLEPNHDNVPFEINNAQGNVIATGTLSTGNTFDATITIESCTGCEGITPHDKLIFTVQQDEFILRDLAQNFHLSIFLD